MYFNFYSACKEVATYCYEFKEPEKFQRVLLYLFDLLNYKNKLGNWTKH